MSRTDPDAADRPAPCEGADVPSGPAAVDIVLARLVSDGLAPAAAMGVMVRAAARRGVSPEALALAIVTGVDVMAPS